jgi:hypothetical protein
MSEISAGRYILKWAEMIALEIQGWDNTKDGMRFAFPPYGVGYHLHLPGDDLSGTLGPRGAYHRVGEIALR